MPKVARVHVQYRPHLDEHQSKIKTNASPPSTHAKDGHYFLENMFRDKHGAMC